MNITFLEDDWIIAQFESSVDISNRNNLGILLKEIGLYLKQRYDYLLDGIYDAEIYQYQTYFVFEIEKVGEYSSIDFNITFHPNSKMLYEFEDGDYILGKKYFYKGKYYIDLRLVFDRLDRFEFGNVIYKDSVDRILKEAIVVS